MKKLLLVTDAWHPQVNGVVRVIEAQLPYLRNQWEVEVIRPGQCTRTISLPLYPEIKLAVLPYRRVRQLFKEYSPDAVHIATEGPLGWAARRVCRKSGVPFTTWYHTHFQLYINTRIPGLLAAVDAVLRRFHASAVCTMVSTESLARTLRERGYSNVVVVPLGVDTEYFMRNPNPHTPELTRPVFVYFSRLAVEKNPDEFFRLDLPGTKLVIGDGPERARLERKYGKTHRFVGYKTGQELIDWLSRADVMVFPSRTETFGLVVLEAMSCGVPVAAHDIMGPRDIIASGVDGYLGEDLAAAAQECLTLSREACRNKALQYSWEHSAEKFGAQLVLAKCTPHEQSVHA